MSYADRVKALREELDRQREEPGTWQGDLLSVAVRILRERDEMLEALKEAETLLGQGPANAVDEAERIIHAAIVRAEDKS